ncbi:MAG: BatA domain-containing protein [bacterium]|nr:BatA domain-containing protein [bacterium]
MSFLHLSLLAGVGAVSVPILLHLFGQRQPQTIEFPALRFVRKTRQEQSTSWQLRHFLLLLLRILLLAGLALALARPRVHSVQLDSILGVTGLALLAALATLITAVAFAGRRPKSVWLVSGIVAAALWLASAAWGYQSLTSGPPVPSADQSAPVAAALIVDNGPTMSYRFQNELRLERAKDLALWVLNQLPIESKVGILGGAPVGSLALDPPSAEAQIKLIEPASASVDLPSRMRTAIDLVLASELERKEVYVVTDLSAASWTSAQPDLREILDQHQGELLVQIIDVGSEEQSNWSLGDPQADSETLLAGQNVTLQVAVSRPASAASNASATIELLQESLDPTLPIIRNGVMEIAPTQVVDRKVVDLSGQESATVQLTSRELPVGTHHFSIRLDKKDPLEIDNQRFVSVVAREQQPTLIVTDDSELGPRLQALADPFQQAQTGLIERIRYSQLSEADLSRFYLVWMHDPPAISGQAADKVRKLVEQGGGLLLVLGPAMGSLDAIQGNSLLSLLPGQLGPVKTRDPRDRRAFMAPLAMSHPIFRDIGNLIDQQLWNPFSVYLNWQLPTLSPEAQVLMAMSDDQSAAIIAENRGQGQIITFTTPIPHVEVRGEILWNDLWIADDPLPAFALLRGALDALYGVSSQSMNFQVNAPVVLRNPSREWPTRYALYLPDGQTRTVSAADEQLTVGQFAQAGIYRLRGLTGEPVSRGFSINSPAADTQLERVEQSLLDEQLGPDNYRLARSRDQVESSVGQARFGRELYPLLMLLVAGLFLAEQAMSNRFYKIKFR